MSDQREQRNHNVFGQEGSPSGAPGIQRMSAAERMKQEFGVVIPAELVTLPSRGAVYPVESGLFKRDQLEIKAMTTREEDILTSRALIKKGTVITELIKSCVIDKSVDVDQLISGDRNALMVAIRCCGYGAIYRPSIECPGCKQTCEQKYDLSKLAIKELEAKPIADGINEFAFKLPVTGVTVTFKFLTGKDEEELIITQERKKKVVSSQVDTLVSDQLKAALLSVNNVRDKAKLAFFVDNMPGRDSLALRDYMKDAQPGIDMEQLFECDKCDYNETGVMEISSEFFWPRRK